MYVNHACCLDPSIKKLSNLSFSLFVNVAYPVPVVTLCIAIDDARLTSGRITIIGNFSRRPTIFTRLYKNITCTDERCILESGMKMTTADNLDGYAIHYTNTVPGAEASLMVWSQISDMTDINITRTIPFWHIGLWQIIIIPLFKWPLRPYVTLTVRSVGCPFWIKIRSASKFILDQNTFSINFAHLMQLCCDILFSIVHINNV